MASWVETLSAFVGGGAAMELIKLFAFRDRDAAYVRERQAREIDTLRAVVDHWRNVAGAAWLRASQLMSEVNDLLEAAGKAARYTREQIFAPPEPEDEQKE